MMLKNANDSILAAITDKVLRLFFCLSIIAALFLYWFPGMIGPHPIEFPVSGWLTLLLSPFLVMMLMPDLPHMDPFSLQFLLILLVLWSAPILSLLNALLVIRRHNFVLVAHRILLGISLGSTIVVIVPYALTGWYLLGFWVYLALLVTLATYEVIVYVTIRRIAATQK